MAEQKAAAEENQPTWPIPRDISFSRCRSDSYIELDTYLKSLIRTIPDFPKPGLNYRDVTTLLLDPEGFKATIDAFVRRYESLNVTHIVSCESRGFIFGAPLALALQCKFVPVRKARRLPGATVGIDYTSGFKSERLEVHTEAIPVGSRVVIVDDMVSTGKTLSVVHDLMAKLQAIVIECGCVIDVKEFRDEKLTKDLPLFALLSYSNE